MHLLTNFTESGAAVGGEGRASATTIPPVPRRLEFLDGLRALACLTVVVDHLIPMIWNPAAHQEPSGLFQWLRYLEVYGQLAVGVFIVVSGFCLMLPVLRRGGELPGGAGHFYAKRARRILPPYYAGALVSLLLIPGRQTWKDLVAHLLLVHNLGLGTLMTINGAYWSIGVEWQIYFWFPVFVWAWRRFGAVRSVTAVACIAFLACITTLQTRLSGAMPHFYILFTCGMLAAAIAFQDGLAWRVVREAVPWAAISAGLAATLFLACSLWGLYGCSCNMHYLYLATGVFALSLLVAASGSRAHHLRRLLEWRPLVRVGSFSYSIYLLHGALLPSLSAFFQRYACAPFHLSGAAAYFGLVAFGLPVILAASYLFYLAFEKPFVNARPARRGTESRV